MKGNSRKDRDLKFIISIGEGECNYSPRR